jgi:glycosyltransferase involved in cell wall biosynthesis
MARIVAIVFNPVSRDARVTKQANSLAAQGHDVTVVGLADNNFPDTEAALDSGVQIKRVPRDVIKRLPPPKPAPAPADAPGPRPKRDIFGTFSKLVRDNKLYLLPIPFIVGYVALEWLGSNRDKKIEILFDIVILSLCAAAVVYFLAYLGSIVAAFGAMARFATTSVLSQRSSSNTSAKLIELAKKAAPQIVEAETERRMRLRTEYIVNLVKSMNPDIVHCHDVHALPAGAELKKQLNCLVIYDAHEIYEEIAQSNATAAEHYKEVHTAHIGKMDGFITINDSIANWYREHYPQAPDPVVIMNATIKAKPFEYDGRLHAAAGLPLEGRILLYQGGYATKRGLEYLVKSAAYLPPQWTLVMMGWGKTEPTLREIAATVNASSMHAREGDAVRFIPPVPQSELAEWSAGATIGVIPYENVGLNHWFCTPNKLWEYPNAGVPVLVSPFPELRKPVELYGYGWLLPDGTDPILLARKVASLTDEEIAAARAACVPFSENENWSKYEERLFALYATLTSKLPNGGQPLRPPVAEAASAQDGPNEPISDAGTGDTAPDPEEPSGSVPVETVTTEEQVEETAKELVGDLAGDAADEVAASGQMPEPNLSRGRRRRPRN